MSPLLRWLPRMFAAVAVVHIAYGFAMLTPFGEIADAKIVDSIDGYAERESAFWYLMSGAGWLALGELARWALRETGRIPARFGGWLVAMGVTGIVFMPASGFWLMAVLGVIALRAAREPERGAGQPAARQAQLTS